MAQTRAARYVNRAIEIEADENLTPPDLDDVERCSHCARKIGKLIYGGWYRKALRYPWLCSKCAAKWVALGGSIGLRRVRR